MPRNWLAFFVRVLLLVISAIVVTSVFTIEISANESVYFIHSDHLGSTSVITQNGQVISKKLYYPYGSSRNPISDIRNPISERQYTGQVSDEFDDGLYYYNARYYDPNLAKFTQADILSGNNRYSYVSNNPIKYTDPSGHIESDVMSDDGNPPDPDPGSGDGSIIYPDYDTLYYLSEALAKAGITTYVAQPTFNTCGPTAVSMMVFNYLIFRKGVMVNITELLASIVSDFPDLMTDDTAMTNMTQLAKYIEDEAPFLDAEYSKGSKCRDPECFREFLAGQDSAVIVSLNVAYKSIYEKASSSNRRTTRNESYIGAGANHLVVVNSVVWYKDRWYVVISDPYRSLPVYNSKKTNLPDGVVVWPGGQILVPWDTFNDSWDGWMLWFNEKQPEKQPSSVSGKSYGGSLEQGSCTWTGGCQAKMGR